MTPSPQGSNSLYGNYETSRSDISPCESLSTSGSKNSESQVDNATVIALLEKFLAGQQELLQMTREIQGRLTNVENAVGLSNNKVSSLTDAVMEKNNDAVLMNEKTFLRKPINKDDPPQALAMVGYQELQKQIDEFIDDDGRNLNVTLNGESFYLDAKMLQAAQYVKSPRQFGPYVFQLALDLTHLANFLLGYLETGRVAGQSKRHNKAPKKLLSEDFNKFFGNLCDLCGGCVVAQKSRKQWFMEVRDGLNSKGDNLFAGSPPIYPNLDYMRSGAQHTPRFNNPDQFIAPPLRKRRLIERNDVEVPERVEPEAVAADNEGSN
uniref:Uncharacterized protein n=1 Tax=Panagrellus redivivus TaxID=6233 RepID=A0A7E4WBH7_PANRE